MANQNIPRSGRRSSNPCSRHFLFLILFLIVPFLFISVVPASAEDAMFRANPEHTGIYDNGSIEPGNTELWRFATGGIVYSSPAVANGIVYVGSEDKNLYAIDAVTGKEKWRFTTGGLVYPSPAVANGIVYVGREDKNLYAVGANSLSLTTVPTTIQVTDTGSPMPQATAATTAPVQRTTQHAPLQYALVGAIVLILGIAVWRRR